MLAIATTGHANPAETDTANGPVSTLTVTTHGWLPEGRSGDAVPTVLARVNGEPVTRTDVRRLLADPDARRQLISQLGDPASGDDALQQLALSRLIQRRLFLQEAARRGITAGAGELDDALAALRGRFTDLAGFAAWMRVRGLDDRTLLDRLDEDLRIARLLAVLAGGVTVSPAEVRAYYEAHPEAGTNGEEVRLRIIAVRSAAEARDILAELRAGASFAHLARQRSSGRLAAAGGDTGWVDVAELPSPLQRVAAQLVPGEASRPLQQAEDAHLIVALAGRRPQASGSFEAARDQIGAQLLAVRRQAAVRAWLAVQEGQARLERTPVRGTAPVAGSVDRGGRRGAPPGPPREKPQ